MTTSTIRIDTGESEDPVKLLRRTANLIEDLRTMDGFMVDVTGSIDINARWMAPEPDAGQDDGLETHPGLNEQVDTEQRAIHIGASQLQDEPADITVVPFDRPMV